MVYTTNILALPFVLLAWAVDMYLLLVMVYVVAGKLSGERASRVRQYLEQFARPMPQAVRRWLERRTAKPVKQWVSWVVVALIGLVIRHLLALLIVSLG